MATTLQSFLKVTVAALINATVQAANQVLALNPSNAAQIALGGNGVRLDYWVTDFSADANALHGVTRFTLSGTTTKTIALTNLATGADSSAGDPTFAKFMTLVFYNDGAADVTVASGASNGASLGLAGTSPTLTIPAGKVVIVNYATAGVTVDGTHKNIDVTPTSGGSFVLGVSGA
jgi:hypothetical protein